MNIAELLNIHPYSLRRADKEKVLDAALNSLSRHHYSTCEPYRRMMNSAGFDPQREYHYTDLMFLPVQLFKTMELCSVAREETVRILSSSGTSGQKQSRIFLDKETAANQGKVLTKVVSSFIGTRRIPMLIVDSESVMKSRYQLPANTAAVLGFSIFGSQRTFVLNEQMELDHHRLMAFAEEHKNEQILIFGFTYKVFRYFYKECQKAGIKPDLSNGVMIHGGGWKKMQREAVSPAAFKKLGQDVCGLQRVHDYYGMVEQTGAIYMECEVGHYHASIFSDIIIRRSHDFSASDIGEEGIIQSLSILPHSYPGHSILTEDKGTLLGEDDCPCGRSGKYFNIAGRLEQAEIRGCSDTHDESFA
ncbi:MAG: acyl-protein synthetase [Bacteroidales bacterium]